MAKMMQDDFESWIRDRCRACIEESEIDDICKGDLDFESRIYTFRDATVQGQWEAWQACYAATQCETAALFALRQLVDSLEAVGLNNARVGRAIQLAESVFADSRSIHHPAT